ncbi:UNVERIFIED_CONTAM: hypothetical protein FKN15_022448, partial [Acipenser sinensis]
GSPPTFCPSGRTKDLDAIVSAINEADKFINVAVMEYFPTTRFRRPHKYWPALDIALRRSAFERHIQIRLLISCWQHSDPAMFPYLKSLSAVSYPPLNISVEVKLYIVPVGNHTDIPFARVNHNKYMVTDKLAYIDDGRTKPVPRKGNTETFDPVDNKCLLRATDGKKKISTVAYSNLLRAHMDGLKKKDKKSKTKKTKATQ